MNSVNDKQREIIQNFVEQIKKRRFLTVEDFNIVYKLFCDLTKLEGELLGITFETDKIDNRLINLTHEMIREMTKEEWKIFEVASCDYSDELGKDICIRIDPVLFGKKYFGSENVEERLGGVIEFLFTIYHECGHAKQMTDVSRGVLSPSALIFAREILLRNIENKFYIDNYRVLSLERHANIYARNRVAEVTEGMEMTPDMESALDDDRSREDEFYADLGKVSYLGALHSKDKLLSRFCDKEIKSFPQLLYMAPLLQKQYDQKGNKLGLITVFEQMLTDVRKIANKDSGETALSSDTQIKCSECQAFYYELLAPLLDYATEQDYRILAQKYGIVTLTSIFSNMEKYFNYTASHKLNAIRTKTGEEYETEDEIKADLKHKINAIVRFRNGVTLNPIAEKLLREGGFIRGTREILEPEVLKRRKLFVQSLIGTYDAAESEAEYRTRAETEREAIDESINALYYNRMPDLIREITVDENKEEDILNIKTVRLIHLLKMTTIMSSTVGIDYLQDFLRIPEINGLIGMIEKNKGGYLNHCIKKVQGRIKKVVYPKTEGEEGKYRGYILGEETYMEPQIKERLKMLMEELRPRKERGSMSSFPR